MASYINHLKFASGMLHSHRFYDAGAIEYDRYIVDKFLKSKSGKFDPDPVGSSLTFSPRIIPDSVDLCLGASLTKGTHSYIATKPPRRPAVRGARTSRSDEVPSDFPADICFLFNYRQCNDDNCTKSHVCRKCNGRHRADSCKSKCLPK